MLFFANNAMLWFLAAAATPLLVHLFARTRPPSAPFSSLRFLNKVVTKTARVRKPKDWLLLVLRTLVILLFALAILQPLLLNSDSGRSANDHHVVVLVDRSGSMGATEGARTRFRRGADMAAEMLESLRPTTANIIWVDAEPDAAFPEPGPNIAFLVDALKRIEPTSEVGRLRVAYDQAVNQLESVEGTKEIILVSDFQRSAWKDAKLPTIPNVKVTSLAASNGDVDNLAVTALQTVPASPVTGQSVTVRCQVSNFSGSNRRVTLFAEIGGSRQSATLDVPANGASETTFPVTFEREGDVAISAVIDEDAFPFDDTRHSVVSVSDALKLVIVAPADSEDARVISRIGKSLPWLECEVIPDLKTAISDSSANYLFISHWKGALAKELRAKAETGTAIICQPGDKITTTAITELFGGKLENEANFREEDSGEPSFAVSVEAEDHEVFKLFASGEFGSPADARFSQRVRLLSAPFSTLPLTTVLAYTDGIPALMVSRADVPPVHIWNLPVNPENHTWSGENFVPFFAEFLLNARGTKVYSNPAEFQPGTRIAWQPDERYHPEAITLVDENDQVVSLETLETNGAITLVTEAAPAPGSYRWKSGNHVVNQSVINFPRSESDLRVLATEEIAMGETVTSRDIDTYTALREGMPLWMWLIGAVILLLLIESFVARWAIAQAKETATSAPSRL